jgi:formylglycine-generating enzyme required for sulfatase activity
VVVLVLAAWFVLRLDSERDRATAAAVAARGHLAEILDLAVSERVADLRRRADALWPLAPALGADLRAWRHDAQAVHAVCADLRARLDAAGSAPVLDFAWRWRQRLLARTVGELDQFLAGASVTPFVDSNLASVVGREALLAPLARASFEGDAARAWDEAAALLAADHRYAGAALPPQFGLRPLGRDPGSGLLEFAHLLTGEPPARDSAGRLVLADRHALILVLVPAGTFAMGATTADDPDAEANEAPVQSIALDAFFVAKHEMTQAQWRRVTGTNPSNHDARSMFVARGADGRHPVENVTWLECLALLPRLGLDLPTEAQWEYAARAGGRFRYGQELAGADRRATANLADRARKAALGPQCAAFDPDIDDAHVMHAPVGSFPPNPFGLHDLAGNVWEWCRDEYVGYATPARPGDGARPCDATPQLAMYRGGAFDCLAVEARCTNRAGAPPDVRQFTVGVRPARALTR